LEQQSWIGDFLFTMSVVVAQGGAGNKPLPSAEEDKIIAVE